MGRFLTTSEFIEKARKVHGDKYDYSKVVYKRNNYEVKIICLKHGEFQQKPVTHLQGRGCRECGKERLRKEFSLTQEEFISRANKVHKNKYDYSLVKYRNNRTKVKIVCPIHGEFFQTPYLHLRTYGCPRCGTKSGADCIRMSQEEFIGKAKKVHGDKYDYSLVNYVSYSGKVKIICPVHGMFEQTPRSHIYQKSGCYKCGMDKTHRKRTLTSNEFTEKAKKVHGDVYDYSLVDYKAAGEKVKIICKQHGEFLVRAGDHLYKGVGCQKCSFERRVSSRLMQFNEFLEKARKIHGNRYDYIEESYCSRSSYMRIVCPVHGEFLQTPSGHLSGSGCSKCSKILSKPEESLAEFFSLFDVEVRRNDRSVIPPYEIDIYLPKQNVAIEYNGVIWHSTLYKDKAENYHKVKHRLCVENGVRFFMVSSIDDLTKIHRALSVICGLDEERIFARKCKVVKITDSKKVKSFFDKYHLQGGFYVSSNVYGLEYRNQIVAMMVFTHRATGRGLKRDESVYELRRYAAVCRVVGGPSKLLKAFEREHPEVREIISFSHNKWFDGKMYERIGFKVVKELPPDYCYINSKEKVRSKNTMMKSKMEQEFQNYDPNLTEEENAKNFGWYRYYDCGKKKWVKTISS